MSRLAWAFLISIAVHFILWGGYSLNKKYHLTQRFHLPNWMQKVAQALVPKPPPIPPPVNNEPPLMYVDVSPAQAVTEAPKNTPFYSDKNAKAANNAPPKNTTIPKIDGKHPELLKTRDVAKNQFDKATPTLPAPKGENAEETQARAALVPGDLTLAKPNQNPKPDEGKAEKTRPRNLKEAVLRNQQLAGQKMMQEGGARNQRLEASFDTRATAFGVYDAALIAAVQKRWYDLLEEQTYTDAYRNGKVVVQFNLNYDGRITDAKIVENTVTDLLGLLCQKSIVDPAPFDKWPRDMRMMVGKDVREIKFSFYYN